MDSPEQINLYQEQAGARFFTAANGAPPTNEQRASVAVLSQYVSELGAVIMERVPEGRNKSIALTALEDVQMRANRGIFAPDEYK